MGGKSWALWYCRNRDDGNNLQFRCTALSIRFPAPKPTEKFRFWNQQRVTVMGDSGCLIWCPSEGPVRGSRSGHPSLLFIPVYYRATTENGAHYRLIPPTFAHKCARLHKG